MRNDIPKHRFSRLPVNLPPRGLSRDEAAAYFGISTTLFDRLVGEGRMPRPIRIYGRLVWDRSRLDSAFEALSDHPSAANDPWGDAA